MMKEKSVMIVTSDKKLSKQISGSLLSIGYRVVGECKDGASALRLARMILPHFIVIDDDLLDQKGIAIGKILAKEMICPIIVFSNKWNYTLDFQEEEGLLVILPKPLQQDILQQFALYMDAAYTKIKALEAEINKLQRDLENRKLIEQAKGLIMEKKQCGEQEAYRLLQQVSMKKMVSLSVLAKKVIEERGDLRVIEDSLK